MSSNLSPFFLFFLSFFLIEGKKSSVVVVVVLNDYSEMREELSEESLRSLESVLYSFLYTIAQKFIILSAAAFSSPASQDIVTFRKSTGCSLA